MFNKKLWVFILLSIVMIFVFLSGIYIGTQYQTISGLIKGTKENQDIFKPVETVRQIIHDQFLNQPVNDNKLIQGALKGMLESLDDPYSAYMDPDEFRLQNSPLQGEYTGIGAWVDTTGEFLVILSSMPDSPAEAAGLQPGDIVIRINGEDMTGLDPLVVLDKILGPAGSKVSLTIRREGEANLLDIEVERAIIPIPSVEKKMLDNNIGYLRLYTFGVNSPEELISALKELKESGAEKIILDLRNNTGGFVDSAVEITSAFLDEGAILVEEWGDGKRNEYKALGNPIDTKSPMIVLVNEGTVSASEITAGALQDYGRAKLVGTTTFGKGFIQNWIPLPNNFGGVRITIARWLTPKGRQIQGYGLQPDYMIEITEEDVNNRFDAQLDKAINLLSNSLE